MGKNFNYAEEFKTLDLEALKKDIFDLCEEAMVLIAGDRGYGAHATTLPHKVGLG